MPLDTCCHCQFVICEAPQDVCCFTMLVTYACLSPLMHVSSQCLSPPRICHHRTLYHWCISAQDICCRWTILTCHFTVPRKIVLDCRDCPEFEPVTTGFVAWRSTTEPPQPHQSHHNPARSTRSRTRSQGEGRGARSQPER